MANQSNTLTLAQAIPAADLPGRVRKRLKVPPEKQGVVLKEDGASEVLPSGKHVVLSAGERLRGEGGKVMAGLIPADSFTLRIAADNLLSGDDTLLDASLLCTVEVSDAAKFFEGQVIPRKVIQGETLDLASQPTWEVFHITRRYLATDLISGQAVDRMVPNIRLKLEAALNDEGIRLNFINFLSVWRAEDRVLAAEKALALQDRLREVELEEKMAKVETEAQFADFLNQLEPEIKDKIGLHPVTDSIPVEADLSSEAIPTGEADPPKKKMANPILDSVRAWVKVDKEKDKSGKHFRIDNLFRSLKKNKSTGIERHRLPQRWWLPRVSLIGGVILMAYIATLIVKKLAGEAHWFSLWEFYLTIWGAAFLAILGSLKTLLQTQENFDSQYWNEPGFIFVDDLIGKDRSRADALIRDQCAQDMQHVHDTLNDLRSRLYRDGKEDAALKIRTLEKKVGRAKEDVLNPNLGVPPYVTDLKVNRKLWEELLDYDEELLIRAGALSADAQKIQQKYTQGEFSLELLGKIEARLDAFFYNFKNRSKIPKASSEAEDKYRM